ncbi:hypothetical protein HF086_016749 [Spodoptera exigua]|uniref:Uncharacterized protein n=1 Tax=Spodoptera exigua TaxID=7107 RepID=A0A922MVL7_SPOEX|nr:hypothetical protein HF086_016749 [Spodoptera exigua]
MSQVVCHSKMMATFQARLVLAQVQRTLHNMTSSDVLAPKTGRGLSVGGPRAGRSACEGSCKTCVVDSHKQETE